MNNCPVCGNDTATVVNTENGEMAICTICGEDYFLDDEEE